MTNQEFVVAAAFHGHKCPAMPLGYRAAQAAMNTLGVPRSQDKELHVIAETGKGHAAGCFLDGIMSATGCTYGKSNIEKRYYNKMAFTLIDVKGKRSVRVRLKDEFFGNMLNSPFVAQRKLGVAPQDVPAEVADPLVEKVMNMPEAMFLEIGPIVAYELPKGKGCFETDLCTQCGERVFVNKLFESEAGRLCVPCQEQSSAAHNAHD
ncbi:MAG: FmdE family protein [Azoarcus sp.]|jgi:formylmethanofuran dehydrogenase subunit E|nr:FmdE family protein [Azoarcus sp.]MDX9838384.1 FmdE family protein [Azoarcus sp.]